MGEKGVDEAMNFLELSNEQRKLVISQASAKEGISANLVEKDWWICQVLKALYTLPCAEHISFKGGTSLSKCWKLIERFSEDVDMAFRLRADADNDDIRRKHDIRAADRETSPPE